MLRARPRPSRWGGPRRQARAGTKVLRPPPGSSRRGGRTCSPGCSRSGRESSSVSQGPRYGSRRLLTVHLHIAQSRPPASPFEGRNDPGCDSSFLDGRVPEAASPEDEEEKAGGERPPREAGASGWGPKASAPRSTCSGFHCPRGPAHPGWSGVTVSPNESKLQAQECVFPLQRVDREVCSPKRPLPQTQGFQPQPPASCWRSSDTTLKGVPSLYL